MDPESTSCQANVFSSLLCFPKDEEVGVLHSSLESSKVSILCFRKLTCNLLSSDVSISWFVGVRGCVCYFLMHGLILNILLHVFDNLIFKVCSVVLSCDWSQVT